MSDEPINGGPHEEPYKVTRGKPPREHQFKPGQSGNPKGRPKGSKELRTLLAEELEGKVEATVGGKRRKLSKREAIVKRLVDKALQGDHKALQTIIRMEAMAAGEGAGNDAGNDAATSASDHEIIDAYISRLIKGGGHGQST